MIRRFLISSFLILLPTMFYHDLGAMGEKKKNKPPVAMTKNAVVPQQDDHCCEVICITVSTVGFGWLAMQASIATESYLRDVQTPSAAIANLWQAGAEGGFVGAVFGEGAYTCYRWLVPKEKQD